MKRKLNRPPTSRLAPFNFLKGDTDNGTVVGSTGAGTTVLPPLTPADKVRRNRSRLDS